MILDETLRNLEVRIRGGGNLVSHRPLFTKDSRHLLVISNDTVHIYSTSTGDHVGVIQTPNLSRIANVTLSSSSHSHEPEQLIVFTDTGDLLYVSLEAYKITQSHNINSSLPKEWTKIIKWLNVTLVSDTTLLLTGHPENEEEVMLYKARKNLESKKGKYHLDKICWKILPSSHAVAVGVDGQLVAAVQSDSVFMTNLETGVSRWHKSGTRAFTCVAAHPHEWIVATGDDSGRILLWRNFLEEKSPAKAVFHWHTLPVADLSFSTDGSKFLSGGSECCLVRWDTGNSSDRKILPRMGLPIRHLAVAQGNTLVAVSHADNCIQLVDESNNIVRVIQNITQCYIPDGLDDKNVSDWSLGGASVFQAGLTFDPRHRSVVMNGKPGHLQCYSLREDKNLYSLDITQQNYVTADRHKVIPNADVTHVTFSSRGLWLATVETLVELKKCQELCLKFWKFDEDKQMYVLNTSITWPHEQGLVNVRLQPGDDDTETILCATAGSDGKFKTWGLVRNTSIHGKKEWWTCENVGSYRSQKAGPLTFAHDGSVLAVPFGSALTLWKTESHEMSGALSHSRLTEKIKFAEFSVHPTSNLVICATSQDLIVWDVITLTLIWRVSMVVESLAVDWGSNLVAVFSSKKHLYFFKPDVPEPLAIHKSVSQSKILSSIFVPNQNSSDVSAGMRSMVIFINTSQELSGMQMQSRQGRKNLPKIPHVSKNSSTLTPFGKLLAERNVSKVKSSRDDLHGAVVGLPGALVIRQLMDISPHTMPSIAYFCNQFLTSLSHRVNESDRMDTVVASVQQSYENYVFSSDSDSDNDSDLVISDDDEMIFGSKGKPRKVEQQGKEQDQVKDQGQEVTLVKVNPLPPVGFDLDSVANDDITWLREALATTK